MNVQFRQRFFDGAAKLDVMPAVHAGRQARLDANFAGAEIARFAWRAG